MICVIGDAGWDMTFEVPALPSHGHVSIGRLVWSGPAGGCGIAAATAATLGAEVVLVTAIGLDVLGDELLRACNEVTSLKVVGQRSPGATQVSVVFRTPDAERTVIIGRGSGSVKWCQELAAALDHASVTLVNVNDSLMRAKCWSALRSHRVLPIAHLEEEARAGRAWDVVVGSIADRTVPDEATLNRAGVSLCVVTDGSRGGHYWSGTAWNRYLAVPAAEVRDATGAGDAFLGGLLVGIEHGNEIEPLLQRAAVEGAKAVMRLGGWPSTGDDESV